MKYQWILFDADETLFHFDAFSGLKRMFSQFDIDFTHQDYQDYRAINEPLWVEYAAGQITATHLQHTRMRPWADKLDMSPKSLNSAFLQSMAEICALLPGAQALLDALSGKVNMGIITNGFTELQTIRLERVGLKELFSPLIISDEVGMAKPDANIFEHAFSLMDNPPKEQILMVGDNPHTDILGGLNAGIDTCWLNVAGAEKPLGIEPHYQVSSLAELQRLLLTTDSEAL